MRLLHLWCAPLDWKFNFTHFQPLKDLSSLLEAEIPSELLTIGNDCSDVYCCGSGMSGGGRGCGGGCCGGGDGVYFYAVCRIAPATSGLLQVS